MGQAVPVGMLIASIIIWKTIVLARVANVGVVPTEIVITKNTIILWSSTPTYAILLVSV